jgi:outer membrane protein OmpA-like peptidoglycan-associated protein
MADVSGNDVPDSAPSLSPDSQPVTPSKHNLPSAPALQEQPTDTAPTIPGNHLTLDPTISTILFDRGSGNIAANVVTTLDRLSAVLTANPDVRISLTAFADNADSTPRDARRLSLTRALAVKEYLASKGVAESRMDVHAEGANTTSGYTDRVDVKVNN